MNENTSRQLKMLGMLLFLLGLISGLVTMTLTNPKMGLAAHLEGLMNGMFLVIVGFAWNELLLSNSMKKILVITLVYGTFANWLFTLLAAIFGTSEMTPISGAGHSGSFIQEKLVNAGLITVALTMLFSLAAMVYGLRGKLNK